MEKKYCCWKNLCGNRMCCNYCDTKKCEYRCSDNNSTCKYARQKDKEEIGIKMTFKEQPLKKWDKNKIK